MAPTFPRWALASLAAFSFPTLSSAANLTFTDCLGSPVPTIDGFNIIQWQTQEVHGSFDLYSEDNYLNITVFGNFSGNFNGMAALPSLSSNRSYWQSNDTANNAGKIINQGSTVELTTLFGLYEVATNDVRPVQKLAFCDQVKGGCPLSPAAPNVTALDQLPQFSLNSATYSNWGLATVHARFTVNYAGPYLSQIICVETDATPYLGDAPANLLRYLPVMVLLLTFVATASAAFSPWGTFNIYAWSSNYGRDEDQLRLITPGFGDCLAYLQFVILTGSLGLVYPGFYQPAVSQVSWSTLMFNQSFKSHSPGIDPINDGVYELNRNNWNTTMHLGQHNGLTRIRQLVGMGDDNDIWPGFMIWLLVVIAALLVVVQLVHGAISLYRYATRNQDEDRRAKNWPFSVGNVIRIVFNYFLLPLIAFCVYQIALVVDDAEGYLVALAAITIIILLAFSGWLLYQILTTQPRSFLFTDLPTLLMYGPLYNTYSDAAAPFALVPMLVNLIRGIAIGAIQVSGIAQIVVLAFAEVLLILGLNAFRPFSSPTSMNLYHTVFSGVRLVVLLLMVAFTTEVNASYGSRAWIGYVILFLHGCVLFFGFFVHSLQTLIEVAARAAGAGGAEGSVQRGGLVKVFGVRQLSRRNPRRSGRARNSMASEARMLDGNMDQENQSSGVGGMRSRSMSASSALLLNSRAAASNRQSLALDTFSQGVPVDGNASSAGHSRGPATPSGAQSVFSYTPGASQAGYDPAVRRTSGMTIMSGALAGQKAPEPADPYYRPPRARRTTNEALGSPATPGRSSAASGDWTKRSTTRLSEREDYDSGETGLESGAPSPAYLGHHRDRADSGAEDPDAPKPDYATREVDYYYGTRGPALNDQPTRKLKTGPADPTGPVSSATGWFQKVFGGKTKDKHKGFEVVRGKVMRQGMEPVPQEEPEPSPREMTEPYTDEPSTPIPEATVAPRKLDLEDETDAIGAGTRHLPEEEQRARSPLEELGIAKSPEDAPVLPDIDAGSSIHVPSRFPSQASRPGNGLGYRDDDVPSLPRNMSSRSHLVPGPRSTALSTIAQSPSGSPASSRRPADTMTGRLSRMPFGSLGSGTSQNTRPSITQRADSIHSAISIQTDEGRPSFQSPPSPIEPPPGLIDASDAGARRESSSSFGQVVNHRTSDNIVQGAPHFAGSQAELVDFDGEQTSPVPPANHGGAHINF